MRIKIKRCIHVFWQGFVETKVKDQRYRKLCEDGQGWLFLHLIVGPDGSINVGDQELQIRNLPTNRYKREVPGVDQDFFRTRAAFFAPLHVLSCCRVLIAVKSSSKTSP